MFLFLSIKRKHKYYFLFCKITPASRYLTVSAFSQIQLLSKLFPSLVFVKSFILPKSIG